MPCFEVNRKLYYQADTEQLRVEAWGQNALRVRATRNAAFSDENWALMEDVSSAGSPNVTIGPDGANIQNGNLTCRINAEGWLSFENAAGRTLLTEYWRNRNNIQRYAMPLNIDAREFAPAPGQTGCRLVARFESVKGERIYGMGQYQDGLMDKKGAVLELAHRNTQASVPFYVSSLGYGFLWNNPAVGRATFGANVTEWEAHATQELDYWICAGDTPAQILATYADVTGHAPMMPEYGMGYWQCRLRYRTQAELLAVAHKHKALGLPLDVIVADFFHWTMQGDFMFDPTDWPDVPAMVKELDSMGIKLMVSVWPTVDSRSRNYREMAEKGYLVKVDRGLSIHMNWMGECVFFDATNPGAREFIWQKCKENYYRYGIRVFWLDEAEPEYGKYDFDLHRYHAGPALQVGNLYPKLYSQAFYDGMTAQGQTDILNLVRCAWAGSQRYGALVWSGDVDSSFRSMHEQLAAGLSMGMAGIPWWNSDLGGFIGGAAANPAFRELLARWFAWGAFTPVMRMHGDRLPYEPPADEYRGGVRQFGSGAPNEVWSFGEETQAILCKYIRVREELRPYTRKVMEEAHRAGAPAMRPLFFDFPADSAAWEEETAYLFGHDLLVAPVLEAGVTSREVYLPKGETWVEQSTGKTFAGGQRVTAFAPLNVIPVFAREGSGITLEGLKV
jgi:alpha-D-xyloside xylohydrolase